MMVYQREPIGERPKENLDPQLGSGSGYPLDTIGVVPLENRLLEPALSIYRE